MTRSEQIVKEIYSTIHRTEMTEGVSMSNNDRQMLFLELGIKALLDRLDEIEMMLNK